MIPSISPGMKMSRYFGTSPGFWLRLELDFELMRAERENGDLRRPLHSRYRFV
jgi:plasmid maintenance system antidote protein VapI